MIKLTVMYDLPEGADHDEFIRWRTTEHQEENMAIPGVLKSDFYVVREAWRKDTLPYRYVTEAYWPDIATFKKAFFDPAYQKKLAKSLEKIRNPLFLISEELLSESKGE
ncbi:MAG: hypothetical protein JXQ30_11400 [Spirochaetes bacterium]|nr:hypothetical protein [Spirochaetota bacterium]